MRRRTPAALAFLLLAVPGAARGAGGEGLVKGLPFIENDNPKAVQEARAQKLPLFTEACDTAAR
jgi:hypothetical protein